MERHWRHQNAQIMICIDFFAVSLASFDVLPRLFGLVPARIEDVSVRVDNMCKLGCLVLTNVFVFFFNFQQRPGDS